MLPRDPKWIFDNNYPKDQFALKKKIEKDSSKNCSINQKFSNFKDKYELAIYIMHNLSNDFGFHY